MAVGQREDRPRARWLHVKAGTLMDHQSGELLGWASGVITGIRMTRSEKFGHLELHIRLHDPEAEPDWQTLIVAGTLATLDKGAQELRDFTIWSRMLVGRLLHKRNQLSSDEPVRIEIYPLETDYGAASCVALYREGSDVRLEGVKISPEDRETMVKGLVWLEDRYNWGAGATLPEVEQDLKVLAEVEGATQRSSESADSVAGAIESQAEDAELSDDPTGAIESEPPGPGGVTEALYGKPTHQRAHVERVANTPDPDDDLPF